MTNHLTLAVAGSGKTRGIAQHCAALGHDRRALVVTFTQTNQAELRGRIATCAGDHSGIEVMGWYTFLLRHFARPFVPFKSRGARIRGFNFDGRPARYAAGIRRFLDSHGAVYACELSRLSNELAETSDGALIRRLERIYDEILIDEVQDLSSHDWQIVDLLLGSSIDIYMVGDIRQAVLSTNPRSSKNKNYEYARSIQWFRDRQRQDTIQITENNVTWRCHPTIANFSDAIFDESWTFPTTVSRNGTVTGHDGIFLVRPDDVTAYVEAFSPMCLRSTAGSGKEFDLDYLNFKVSKGMTRERVLIVPTGGIRDFIRKGKFLEPIPAAAFYVAVTRARQSVAVVIDDAGGDSRLEYWAPYRSLPREADVS